MLPQNNGHPKRDEFSPLTGSHPEHYLPLSQHKRLQDRLNGRPLPNVLPHSIEAGRDSYYIGDVYEPYGQKKPWEIDINNRPYLKHIKNVSRRWPSLSYLASWMEVTTSPVKWKHLPEDNRAMRAERTRVEVIDFPRDENGKAERRSINKIDELHKLFAEPTFNHDPDHSRLFVLEDLSRDVIEIFGSRYDIDPLFWRGHISDYLWFNTRDPWVELDDLPHIIQGRNFYHIRYVHPRYFKNRESYLRATEEAGMMNVLRRLDDDRISAFMLDIEDAVIGMCRSKASLWIRRNDGQQRALGILIVDPTFKEGHPLWGGYRNFDQTPNLKSIDPQGPPKGTLFEDVIYWTMKMSIQQVKELDRQPRNLAVAILTIVAAEWLTVKEYVTTRLTQIEWELEIPDFRGHGHLYGLDSSLKRLHPFRRILPVYRKWVIDVLKGILGSYHFSADEQKDRMLRQLRDDFLGILEEIEIVQAQVQNMVSVVTAIMSIEETKRSAEQNKNINRLTYLAVVFVPMSFISSLFSMTSDVASLHQTFWIFLALAIPLTLFALSIAQWSHIKVWCKKFSLLLSLN